MRVAFFELEGWEAPEIERRLLPAGFELVALSQEPLTPSRARELGGVEAVSVFIHSRLDARVFDALPGLRLVATRSTGWTDELVASTAYAGPAGDGDIDVRIHALAGHLWVEWIDAEGSLAFSEWDGAADTWGAARHETYTWGEATGETEPVARERARARIRMRVLGN